MSSGNNHSAISKELKRVSDPKKAEILRRFFKTGKGQYGEGDKFLGVVVPKQRLIAKNFKSANLETIQKLLHSEFHEERLTALLILTYQFSKASEVEKKKIYNFYLKNTKWINNWDLVDLTAPNIVGGYLQSIGCHSERERRIYRRVLYILAKSKNLWERRIAVLATFAFIRNIDFADSLKISQMLINDKHDLIHKAVGWMLREIGKRDMGVEERFLKEYYTQMPRMMLRYAIERFPEPLRKKYLVGKV